MVRLAGIQRRVFLWGELKSSAGLLEYQSDGHVRFCDVGASRLEISTKVVHGWLVLRRYLWPCCCHACIWILYPLGVDSIGRRCGSGLQLCYKG